MNNRLRMIELFNKVHECQRNYNIYLTMHSFPACEEASVKLSSLVSKATRLIYQFDDKNIFIDDECNTLLHLAGLSGNITLINYILSDPDVDCNIRNARGETALQRSCLMLGNVSWAPIILRLLERKDVDIKIKNNTGLTALDYAVLCVDELIVEAMLVHDSMTIEFYFETINKALVNENIKMVKVLLEVKKNDLSILKSLEALSHFANRAVEMGYLNVASKIKEINPQIGENNNFLENLLNHKNKKQIQKYINWMNVRNGFCNPILEKRHAKLYFSAKYEKNKHRKRVAILEQDEDVEGANEFETFLQSLGNIVAENKIFSTRIQFILTSRHWISGDIKIQQGRVSVLFIDPLGSTYRDSWLDSILLNSINRVYTVFPEAEIYASVEYLQHNDFTSCTMFAIDNASHLYNQDKYLKKTAFKGDLHDYLKAHSIQKTSVSIDPGHSIEFNFSYLPLRMIRCMQSLKTKPPGEDKLDYYVRCGIFGRIASSQYGEDKAPVNKKNDNMRTCAQQGIGMKDNKEVNIRLFNKLNSAKKTILNYMGSVSKERTSHNLRKFGVKGIVKTLEQDSKKQLGPALL